MGCRVYRSADENICDPRLASIHYYSLFYGTASKSYFADGNITDVERYHERMRYAIALSQIGEETENRTGLRLILLVWGIGDVEAARSEFWVLLETHPMDYAVGFMLLQAELLLMMRAEDNAKANDTPFEPSGAHPRTLKAMHTLDKAFASVGQYMTSNFTGFDPSPVLRNLLSDVVGQHKRTLQALKEQEVRGEQLGKYGDAYAMLSKQLLGADQHPIDETARIFDMNDWTPKIYTSLMTQEVGK
jgi:hypothetical protein